MTSKIAADPRIDPRLKALFAWPDRPPVGDIESREALLAAVNTPEALAAEAAMEALFNACDSEANAPSAGLSIKRDRFVPAPDGNEVQVAVIRPDTASACPASTTSMAAA